MLKQKELIRNLTILVQETNKKLRKGFDVHPNRLLILHIRMDPVSICCEPKYPPVCKIDSITLYET